MKLIIYSVFGIALATTMFGCSKSDNPEPAEIFSCKIEEINWSYAECNVCLTNVDALYARPKKFDTPHFEIYAQNNDDIRTTFQFIIDTTAYKTAGTIQLNSHQSSYCIVTKPLGFDTTNNMEYQTINGSQGQLIFTEKTSSMVRGTFQFDVTNGNKIIHITDGKFKIKL